MHTCPTKNESLMHTCPTKNESLMHTYPTKNKYITDAHLPNKERITDAHLPNKEQTSGRKGGLTSTFTFRCRIGCKQLSTGSNMHFPPERRQGKGVGNTDNNGTTDSIQQQNTGDNIYVVINILRCILTNTITACTCMHAPHTHSHTYSCMHTHMQVCTHTHTHTHTHTPQTKAHFPVLISHVHHHHIL